jgi:hypothetical protein
MTINNLRDELADAVTEALEDMRFPKADGSTEAEDQIPINIYKGRLPVKTGSDASAPFPYVIVKVVEGTAPGDRRDPASYRTLLLIGVRERNTDADGFYTVSDIVERLLIYFSQHQELEHYFRDDRDIRWTVNDSDELFPYAYAGLELFWSGYAPAPTEQEDPYI